MAVSENKRRFMIAFSKELFEKVEAYCSEAGISKSAYLSLLAAKDLEDTDKYLVGFRDELKAVMERLNIEAVPK